MQCVLFGFVKDNVFFFNVGANISHTYFQDCDIFLYFLVSFIKPGARNPRWTEEETIMLCTLVKNNRFVIHVSSFTDSKQLEKLLILCFVIYCFNFLMQETCILNSIAQLENDAV